MKLKIFLIIALMFAGLAVTQNSNTQTIEKQVGNALFTKHGGIAFKFTTNTLVQHGQIVAVDTGTGYVKLADTTNGIGVAYLSRNTNKDSAVTGTVIWVVVSGIAETRILTADSAATSRFAVVSTTAGIADLRDWHTDYKESVCGWAYQRRGYQNTNGYWYSKLKLEFR